MQPHLFIGIPCYQDSESLQKTVQAIERTTAVPHELQVHVAKQSVVRNKNDLLKKARASGAKYVCLCDDDVEPEKSWSEKLIDGIEEVHARTHRRVGQTSPLFIYPDGSIFCLWVNVTILIDLENVIIEATAARSTVVDSHRAMLEAGALAGTLTIHTREFLDQIDWKFDERYEKSQHEDIDQSLSCRSKGFMSLYKRHVTVIHHTQATSPRSGHENHQKLISKWGHRADLSLSVQPHQGTIGQANQMLFTRSKNAWNLGRVVALLTKNPVQRIRTSVAILRRAGIKGLINQCRYKISDK